MSIEGDVIDGCHKMSALAMPIRALRGAG